MYPTLLASLAPLRRAAVAYSGGVDSALLLRAAIEALGSENVLALTAVTPLMTPGERRDAAATAHDIGARHIEVGLDPLALPEVAENTPLRCYHCKKAIMGALLARAAQEGFALLCDGQNSDDAGVYRPGRRASAELGVLSPLKAYSKAQIRVMAAALGLSAASKPASPCLATRIPYGTAITPEALGRIAAGEAWLRERGYDVCRVRDHGNLARIEVENPAQLVSESGLAEKFSAIGYDFVTVDVRGYRSGCYDEKLEN